MQQLIDLPDYYQNYLSELDPHVDFIEGSVNEALGYTFEEAMNLFSMIHEQQKDYAYDIGKWTIAEVFGHLIDTERIFSYRALRIARGDKQNFPGYDQDQYVVNSQYQRRAFDSIKQEFYAVMESTGYLFEGLTKTELEEVGNASDFIVTPRTIGFVTAAHRLHHFNIIKERYLSN